MGCAAAHPESFYGVVLSTAGVIEPLFKVAARQAFMDLKLQALLRLAAWSGCIITDATSLFAVLEGIGVAER